MKLSILALAGSLALAACSPDEPRAPVRAASPEDAEPARAEVPATKQPDAPAAEAPPAKRGELAFTPAADWIVETPVGAMRKAQYKLPRAEGDAVDAELVVFFNGKLGNGPIEVNLKRWASQFEVEGGGVAREKLVSSTRRTDAASVTEASIEGTYVAEKTPGSGERYHEPGWKLMGAILESEAGPYYVRLVGPKATVDAHAAAFREFVSSAR
jgi:hypothetical protein